MLPDVQDMDEEPNVNSPGTSGDAGDKASDEETTMTLAARLAARHTAAATAAVKRNLRSRPPLTAGLGAGSSSLRSKPLPKGLEESSDAGSEGDIDESDDEDAKQLQRCRDMYAKLPKYSNYAQFKLRTLNKAMQLLAIKRAQRNDEQNAKLMGLFRKLGIK